MKRIWIALVILLLVFAATMAHSFYIQSFTDDLAAMLEAAEVRAEEEAWADAAELTQTVWDKWDDKSFYLHSTLRHAETDAVYTGLREVMEFIQCREGGEYSAANARLIASLELLAEAEQLTLKNIL